MMRGKKLSKKFEVLSKRLKVAENMTVAVLMSTYNGEMYIDEQISSILNQKNVETYIFIRDDGSSDGTVNKIKKWKNSYPYRIEYYLGENKGYRKSFLKLLELVPDSFDYYAFADQDDFWLENKCFVAVRKLQGKKPMSLYISNLKITDSQLNELHVTRQQSRILDLRSYWTRPSFAGCTFVFTSKLKQYAKKLIPIDLPHQSVPSHDFFVATVAFVVGDVVFDKDAYILHRRTENSVTSGGRGIVNRIKVESKVLFREVDVQYLMAKHLLEKDCLIENSQNKKFLTMVAQYKDNLFTRIALMFGGYLRTGKLIFNIGARIKILISNY